MLHPQFWIGLLVGHLCVIYMQDKMGLDRYIEHVRENWIELPPSVSLGLIIILAIASILMEFRERRMWRSIK